jgi:hypothetical protein
MFAYVQNNQFEYFIAEGTAFTIGDIQYPANWLNLSTPEEKTNVGIVDVIYSPRPDDKYYWISQGDPIYHNGKVTVDYITTPKNLDECKSNAINKVNSEAYSILFPTDWMVVKSMETGVSLSPEWSIWRQKIRTQASDYIAEIESCTTVEDLSNLKTIVWSNDPNYIKPSSLQIFIE